MELFAKEALLTIRESGTITPSSQYLVNDCLKDISFDDHQVILEFGAGNGCITQQILRRMPSSSQLIAFETNRTFLKYCDLKFSYYENFEIHSNSAVDFDLVLDNIAIQKVDYIISSLPLSLIKQDELTILFDKIPKYLKQDGHLIQYQYSLGKYRFLRKKFNNVKIDFTLRNIPPAFIYKCT